jgi:pyruvyl transferase EpsI
VSDTHVETACRAARRGVWAARKSCAVAWRCGLFAARHRRLFREAKIIYALTPPARLSNIGDHAQVVAIHLWLGKHFVGVPVVELDKDQSTELMPVLRRFISPDDVIFLHSGGNLGDRGLWSENARRAIIRNFPATKVVSLPQTIFFADTEKGTEERRRSARIYATHPDLTVIGRDPESGEIASRLFPRATTFSLPDFVLSLPPRPSASGGTATSILLCLRVDNESLLDESQRRHLAALLPYGTTRFDTTLPRPLEPRCREEELARTLSLFAAHDAVVTDRYHGLIFAVLCGKPTVVLRTVDHKLLSAMAWFREMPQVTIAGDVSDVPGALERVLAVEQPLMIDWNAAYFDPLPERLGLSSGISRVERGKAPR